MDRAGTLDISRAEIGISADEIVALALANVGQSWAGSAAGFVWGISNLGGLPFFHLRDFTDGPANSFIDPDYYADGFKVESPHRWNDNNTDGWELVWSDEYNARASDVAAVLKPGDVVRVYDYGNYYEHSEPDNGDINSHSFIVVGTSIGTDGKKKIDVVGAWGDSGKVVQHDWADIVEAMTHYGKFQSAYVSRINQDYVDRLIDEDKFDPDSLQGAGYGDWSSFGSDLTVSGTPTATLTADGQNLTVNYVAKNAGTMSAAASTTAIYLSRDATITSTDKLLGTDAVGALLAGATSNESGSFSLAGVTPGTYYVGIVTDHNELIGETNESNNIKTLLLTIGADLDITSATAPTITSDGKLSVTYQLANIGTVTAGASMSGIYLSTDQTISKDDVLVGTDLVAAILAGQSSAEGGTFALPTSLAAGTYYVGIVSDIAGAVGELSESNNSAFPGRVTLGADLDIASSPAPAATLSADGKSLTVTYRANNIGTTTAAASKTGIYLSTDATITTSDTRVAIDDVAALIGGAGRAEGGTFALPSTVAPGTYYVGLIADYDSKIGELNEANNTASLTRITLGADLDIAATPVPTFAVSSNGRQFTVGYDIANLGLTTAAASKTGIYLSTDATITTSDLRIGVDDVAALAGGGKRTEGGTFNFAAGGIKAGTYYVGLIADYDAKIGELSETNNGAAVRQVTLGADLDVRVAPTLAIPWAGTGGTYTLTYKLENLGNVFAPASKVGIYLSTDSTITTADRLIAVEDVAALLAGTSRMEGGAFTLPGNIAGGNYYIGVVADYLNVVSETNETNNPSTGVRITVFSNNADTLTVPTGEKAWHGLGGNDTITGSLQRDALYGDGGNDVLLGRDGNDTLIGGAGADRLTGGVGSDYYQFNNTAEIGKALGSRDIITDWDPAADYIDLRNVDANSTTANVNDAFAFVAAAGSAFSGVRGQLRWYQENNSGTANDRTIIAGDTNGDRIADFTLELTGLHNMRAVDFLL